MFAVFFVSVLCLISVSMSAPLACEGLVRPLDLLDPHHLEGRWALVAGSVTLPYILEDVTDRGSRTVYFSNSSETSVYTYTQVNRFNDQCDYLSYNFTIKNNTITSNLESSIKMTWSFLNAPCSDCYVIRSVMQRGKWKLQDLYLFSRRRELEQKEMEQFLAQVECLKMPPAVVMNPTKELCPEQTTIEAAAQTEEKTKELKR